MDRFPLLGCGDRVAILPLCHNTALDVGRVLLRDGDGETKVQTTQALRLDPVFALWCVCQADRYFSRLPTLDQVAAWFLDQGPARFAVLDPDDSLSMDRIFEVDPSFLETVGIALHCGGLAAQYAKANCGDEDETFLFGLLSEATAILTAASRGDTQPAAARSLMPAWLLALLEDVQSQRQLPEDCPQACVRHARLAIASGTARPDAEVRRAASRYQQAVPAAGGLLVSLCQKTSRLRALENDFENTLEREKLASLKQLAYGASHEINNPLANISTRAQTLLRSEADPERRRQLASINSQAFRAHEMIADMMLFAHPPRIQTKPTKVGTLIESLIGAARDDARQQGTHLSLEISDNLPAMEVDPVQLAVAVKALIRNAVEALGSGGRVAVTARVVDDTTRNPPAAIEICVADDGPGISAEVRRHLFDPFYSGREAGRGLGFGLAKCWRIAELHGGTILVDSQPGYGASLTLRLPVLPQGCDTTAESDLQQSFPACPG